MEKAILFVAMILFSFKSIGQSADSVEPAFAHLMDFPNIRDFTLSSTGDEAYISVQSPLGEFSVLAIMTKVKDDWSDPEVVNFSGKYKDLEPFLSKNGLRLYFASNRPLNDSVNETKDFDIWYVERNRRESEWGTPVNMGAPINSEDNEFYPSIAHNGNMYFTCDGAGSKGKDDIFYSAWRNNAYTTPVSLGTAINTEGYEYNAYIAYDEAYLIFGGYNRADGFGSGDLYISYRDEDGAWSNAVNLGERINSRQMDYCPYVDVKTMTMYFTSKRSDIVEVNDFHSIGEVLEEINRSENGLSRLYKVAFENQ